MRFPGKRVKHFVSGHLQLPDLLLKIPELLFLTLDLLPVADPGGNRAGPGARDFNHVRIV